MDNATRFAGAPPVSLSPDAAARLARVAARAAAAPGALVVVAGEDGFVVSAAAGRTGNLAPGAAAPGALSQPLLDGVPHAWDAAAPGPLSGPAAASLIAVPVAAKDGRVAASLCAVDRAGRAWTEEDRNGLADAAALAAQALRAPRDEAACNLPAREALQKSEEHFRFLIENAADMIAVLDRAGTVTYASPSFSRSLEVPAEGALGRSMREVVHADDHACARDTFRLALRHPGTPQCAELRLCDGRGGWRACEVTGVARVDAEDARVVIAARDVTDRRRAAAELRASEQRFRILVDAVQDYAIILLDADGYVTSWNPGAERIMGYPSEQALGRHVSIFYPRELAVVGVPGRTLDRAVREGRTEAEGWNVRMDGSLLWMNTVTTALRDESGRLMGYAKIARDLSERREAELALRRNEALLRSVLEGITESIFLKDLEGRFVLVNAACARMLSRTPDELVGRTSPELWNDGRGQRMEQLERRVLESGEPATHEFRELDRHGRLRVFAASFAPFRDQDGRITGVLGVAREITEQRALEEQFRQAQKMEAVGQLAGGVAHDFNNILMAVGGHVQLLLRRAPEGDPSRWSLEEIRSGTTRAAALTRQLLAFSRRQVLRPRLLDLNGVVQGMTPMLERLIGADIEMVAQLDPAIGAVMADPSQLEQVVMNLAVNARDAMPDGGVVVISTGEAWLTAADRVRASYVVPGPYVVLSVTDSGQGMDAATMERIFEPFFTTKESGKGTGLGLATVYGIVKQSGGYIWAESIPGRATTFRVYFPRESAAAAPEARPAAGPRPRGGTETVLLAEDEPAVRALAGTVLREAGYTVIEAENGAGALKAAAAHPGPVHLLLTDVVMPGMGGRELARRLREARPGVPVIFMSGYAEEVAPGRAAGDGGAYVQKPITPDDLARRVRQALDAAAEAP